MQNSATLLEGPAGKFERQSILRRPPLWIQPRADASCLAYTSTGVRVHMHFAHAAGSVEHGSSLLYLPTIYFHRPIFQVQKFLHLMLWRRTLVYGYRSLKVLEGNAINGFAQNALATVPYIAPHRCVWLYRECSVPLQYNHLCICMYVYAYSPTVAHPLASVVTGHIPNRLLDSTQRRMSIRY